MLGTKYTIVGGRRDGLYGEWASGVAQIVRALLIHCSGTLSRNG